MLFRPCDRQEDLRVKLGSYEDGYYRYQQLHNVTVEEEERVRISPLLNSYGENLVINLKRNKIGFDLTPKKDKQ